MKIDTSTEIITVIYLIKGYLFQTQLRNQQVMSPNTNDEKKVVAFTGINFFEWKGAVEALLKQAGIFHVASNPRPTKELFYITVMCKTTPIKFTTCRQSATIAKMGKG